MDNVHVYLNRTEENDVAAILLIASIIATIVPATLVYFVPSLSKQSPVNIALVAVTTAGTVIMVLLVATVLESGILLFVTGITSGWSAGIFLYSCLKKINLRSSICVWNCVIWGIVCTCVCFAGPLSVLGTVGGYFC